MTEPNTPNSGRSDPGPGPDTGAGKTGASGSPPEHGGGISAPDISSQPGVRDEEPMHASAAPYAGDMMDDPSAHTHHGHLSTDGGSSGSGGGGADALDTVAGASGPMTPTPSVDDTGSPGSPSNEHDVSESLPHVTDYSMRGVPAPGSANEPGNEPGPEGQP